MADPERERRRLAEFYASEMDGRLEKIAAQAYELSDVAREALRAELAKRGISTPLAEEAPEVPAGPHGVGDPPLEPPPQQDRIDGEFAFRPRITLRKFRDLPEALMARSSLEASEIDCALVDENVVRLDWFWSNLMGGVKLLVDPEDAAAANDVLAQPIPEQLDVSGMGVYEQPRCPSCGSLDVNFREIAPLAYVLMWVNFPLPFHRKAWRCHTCNVQWEDIGGEEPVREGGIPISRSGPQP